MTNDIYDLAVIGGGTAGLVAATVAASLGAKTALIERARIGGECLWTGCVPSKTLIRSARAFDMAKRAAEFGVHVEAPRLIWSAVKLRIADVRDEIKALEREEIKKAGFQTISGTARFEDAGTLRIQNKDGEHLLRARKFILATGSKARVPEIDGLREAGFLTHETIYDLPSVPRAMTIVGGGPIACEFAQAFARFGTKVTMLQRGERLLPREDAEISAAAHRVLEQSGVTIHLGAQATRVRRDEDDKTSVEFRNADGATQTVTCNRILVATGKEADVESLNLGAAQIRSDEHGVVVDDYLHTSARHVWACGDVIGKFLFTHAAEYAAKIAVQNALLPLRKKADWRVVPWTTFTDPEIAHLGLSEAEAAIEYSMPRIYRSHFKNLDRAIIEGETSGFLKVVCAPSGRIVGVHIIGPAAGELIHAFVPAVRDGMLIAELAETIHVHPTLSEIGHRAGNDSYRELLDNKTVQRLLRFWMGGKG